MRSLPSRPLNDALEDDPQCRSYDKRTLHTEDLDDYQVNYLAGSTNHSTTFHAAYELSHVPSIPR